MFNNNPDAMFAWEAIVLVFRSVGVILKLIAIAVAMILCLPLALIAPMLGVHFFSKIQCYRNDASAIARRAQELNAKAKNWDSEKPLGAPDV